MIGSVKIGRLTKTGRKAPAFRPGDISPWPDRANICAPDEG